MDKNEFENVYLEYKAINIKEHDITKLKNLYFSWNDYDEIKSKSREFLQLSYKEIVKDINDLFLLIKYCYSGYDYYQTKIDFYFLKEKLIKDINENVADNKKLYLLLKETFKLLLNDGHFSISSNGESHNFWNGWYAYSSGIIVEECGDFYIVVKGNRKLPVNTKIFKIDLENKLLKTLPLNKNDCYLIAIYSRNKIPYIFIGDIKLKTHIIYSDKFIYENETKYNHKLIEHKKYNIFINRNYKNDSVNRLEDYNIAGKICSEKNIVIWDICGNRGGNSNFPKHFILGLNQYANWKNNAAILKNPIFNEVQKNKIYSIELEEDYDYIKSKYKGDLYVCMNKWVASSGESAISYAKSCKNVKFFGSASGGIGQFGDVKLYQLNYSKIILILPYKIFQMEEFEEGKGFLPDYWIDSPNPVNYFIKYLKRINYNE